MDDGKRSEGQGKGAERRRVVYCLIPPDLAPKLHDQLREHFRDVAGVEVVVERRGSGERRRGAERRAAAGEPPGDEERRLVRARAGRRVGERRAAQVPVAPPDLPRRARRYADRLGFVERLEPATLAAEDADTARVVARFQAGDEDAFATLYTRHFERIYGYLRVALRDHHEAEDAAQEVFVKLLEGLPSYERRRQPFRAWLFIVVRNTALDRLRRNHDIAIGDWEAVERVREQPVDDEVGIDVMEWISDPDLLLFVERLPPIQRQVLLLRYMLDLKPAEVARALDITANHVRVLHHRALRFLEDRLEAIGRSPRHTKRSRSRRCARQAPVLRSRKWALE